MSDDGTTVRIQRCLERLQAGDETARAQLLTETSRRFRRLARKLFRTYPGLRRYVDSDDLVQNASLRLWRTLEQTDLQGPRHFLNLGAQHIRRGLIDLARHYLGPRGPGAQHQSRHSGHEPSGTTGPQVLPADSSNEPSRLAAWTEFHEHIEALPEDERELFDLLWYQGLKLPEAAELLGVSPRVVRYRWQQARLRLVDQFKGKLPA